MYTPTILYPPATCCHPLVMHLVLGHVDGNHIQHDGFPTSFVAFPTSFVAYLQLIHSAAVPDRHQTLQLSMTFPWVLGPLLAVSVGCLAHPPSHHLAAAPASHLDPHVAAVGGGGAVAGGHSVVVMVAGERQMVDETVRGWTCLLPSNGLPLSAPFPFSPGAWTPHPPSLPPAGTLTAVSTHWPQSACQEAGGQLHGPSWPGRTAQQQRH